MDKGVILNNSELFVSGEIGWDFRADDFIRQINSVSKDEKINVHIYSGGGNLMDALAIYDFIKLKGIKFDAYISGLSGSAATIIGACAENTYIGANSFYFVHRAFIGSGSASEEANRMLDNANKRIVSIYQELTGMSKPQIKKILDSGDNGEFLTAQEAVNFGFVNSQFKEAQLAANIEIPFHKEITKEEITNKININQKQNSEMEMNEEKVADSVFAKIKNYFQEEKKEVVAEVKKEEVIENKVSQEELIKNAVASAMESAQKENEALKAQLAEKEAKLENSIKEIEKNEALAKAQATKTEVESKEDTDAPVVKEELAYASAIKNLVKQVKQIN